MTGATVPHGTPTGYRRGCRLDCCRTAERLACKQADVRRARAGGHLWVDATATRRQLQRLAAAGYGAGKVAAEVNLSEWAVRKLATGRSLRVRTVNAEMIARFHAEVFSVSRDKYPVGPLVDKMEALHVTQTQMERRLGTRVRWGGPLTVSMADRAATVLGCHPVDIWGDRWYTGVEVAA